MTFTVSKAWIHDNKTTGGSWNAKQLKCLGIAWQPPKGWIKRVVGQEISIETKEAFESYAGENQKLPNRELVKRIKVLEHQVAVLMANQ